MGRAIISRCTMAVVAILLLRGALACYQTFERVRQGPYAVDDSRGYGLPLACAVVLAALGGFFVVAAVVPSDVLGRIFLPDAPRTGENVEVERMGIFLVDVKPPNLDYMRPSPARRQLAESNRKAALCFVLAGIFIGAGVGLCILGFWISMHRFGSVTFSSSRSQGRAASSIIMLGFLSFGAAIHQLNAAFYHRSGFEHRHLNK